MKKIIWASLIAMMSFVACDEVKQGGDDPDQDYEQDFEPITQNGFKVKLEDAAEQFMNEFPASEYEELASTVAGMVEYCSDTFGGPDYDLSALEEVYEERYDKFFSEEFVSETVTSYSFLFLLSECKGHLEFGKNGVTYRDSKDTSAEFTDGDGVVWTLSIIPSGSTRRVFLGEFCDVWYGWDYDPSLGESVEREYEDYYDITIEIPEKLTVELKKNGRDYASVVIGLDVKVSSGGVDIERDAFSFSTTVVFEGLEYTVGKVAYNASTGNLEVSSVLKKDGKLIVSEKVTANGKVYWETEKWTAKKINVEVDILGLVQIKGTCPDVNSIVNIIENSEPETDEDFEEVLKTLNSMFSLGVYFDGEQIKRAELLLEPRIDDYGDYYVNFVIEFDDGSKTVVEGFFNEDNFSGTVGEAGSFFEDYIDLFEEYFEIYGY